MRYTPHTRQDVETMLAAVGMQELDELFADIPEAARLRRPLDIGPGMDEITLRRAIAAKAKDNLSAADAPCFLGAGCYDHFVPAAVGELLSRGEFVTAYTPYQPEMSQGILQSIFEYQTEVCRLTGMEASNASLYDGASALGEALRIAWEQTRRPAICICGALHPAYREVARAYLKPGTRLDNDAIGPDTAAVVIQQPDFLGRIVDAKPLIDQAHAAGALAILVVNPIAQALLKTPGELGADYAVGDGQPLGCGMNFGGPSLGFIATGKKNLRRLPGRIVGLSEDTQGRRAFVLTLQAREQHIRRDKAASNICSNQALNALAANIYLTVVGGEGLCAIARRCHALACMAEDAFQAAGISRLHHAPYFHEFAIALDDPEKVNDALYANGIIGGLPVEGGLLLAFTEKRTPEEIQRLVRIVKEAL